MARMQLRVEKRWGLGLVAMLLIAAPAVVVRLGGSDVRYHMEVLTFASSQETWQRQEQGEAQAWRLPSLNGAPRVKKPPMSVWVNLLAWSGLGPDAPVEALALRARLAGVALMGVMLASMFWLGVQTQGVRLGFLAALATGTMLLTIKQGRMATYDAHLAGWLTLAIAAGCQAVGNVPALTAGRRGAVALVAGLALAAAILTKGPLAIPLAVIPWVVLAWGNRVPLWRAGWFTVLALVVAVLVVTPWYVQILGGVVGAGAVLWREYRANRDQGSGPWHYAQLLPLVFPWSLAFAGGLVFPFLVAREQRRRWLQAWLWLVLAFVLMSLSETKRVRYILPLLPPVGLLVAGFWQAWPDLMVRPWAQRLNRAHWGMLEVGALVVAVLPWGQGALLRTGMMHAVEFPVRPAWTALLAGVGLWWLARVGRQAWVRGQANWAAVCTALWMAVAATFGNYFYVESRHGHFTERAEIVRVGGMVGRAELRYLELDVRQQRQPDAKLLLYMRRAIPPVEDRALAGLAADGAFVIARVTAEHGAALEAAGFRERCRFSDGRRKLALYAVAARGNWP